MNTQEIINAITECTPLYEDIAKLICEYNKPFTFEIGKVYYQVYSRFDGRGGNVYRHKVIKKTKCFITIQDIDDPEEKPQRLKIRITKYSGIGIYDEGDEYVEISHHLLCAKNEWKNTSKIFIDKSIGTLYVRVKPRLPRRPPPELPCETPQLPTTSPPKK